MNKSNKIGHTLDFLKAHPAFEKQEIVEQATYYTTYRVKSDRDIDHYKSLTVQYWKNFVIIFEGDASISEPFVIVDRTYFDTTKGKSLIERCYRFLPKLEEENSSRPKNGDLLDEKNDWCILSQGIIREIKRSYRDFMNVEINNTSRYHLVENGIKYLRTTSIVFALLSAVENLWETFKAMNTVNKTRFISTDSSQKTLMEELTGKDKYIVDTKPEELAKLKELLLSDNEDSSYRHFFPEDVDIEKERRHKEAEEEKLMWQKILEEEAREYGNFGVYAAMVAEGELHPIFIS